jgi:hypothetical protein
MQRPGARRTRAGAHREQAHSSCADSAFTLGGNADTPFKGLIKSTPHWGAPRVTKLQKEIVELPVEQLRLGIYVSRLDRPWEETPFLFQGFAVGSDEELATLRSLCKSVYVEVSVAEAEETEGGEPQSPRDAAPQRKTKRSARAIVGKSGRTRRSGSAQGPRRA